VFIRILKNKIFSKFILALLIVNIFGGIAECGAVSGDSKYSKKATELLRNRDYNATLQVLNIGIAKYPYSGALYYKRGVVYQDYFHEYHRAILDYDNKLKIDKRRRADYAKIYYRRAVCKYKLGLIILSIRDFNTAISLSPRYDKAYFSRAKAYAKIGRLDKSKEDLQSCVKLNPVMTRAARQLLVKIMSGKRDF
jgi:tetratricopeptide (TPR) repeat protein